MSTLPGFSGENVFLSTERYACIKGYIQNKNIRAVISIIIFFAQDFKKIIKTLKTNAPMIYVLFPKCVQLLQSVFGKFLETEIFKKKK